MAPKHVNTPPSMGFIVFLILWALMALVIWNLMGKQ
jgi:hypothetical protein